MVLEPFGPGSAWFPGAVGVYARTWDRNWHKAWEFIAQFARYPHYRGLVALEGDRVVGMIFGHQSLPGQWWHDRVAARVGWDHPSLTDAWVVVELAVLPACRNRAIGRRLLETLLEQQPFSRAILSTQVENEGARRFYERLGWGYLHEGFIFAPGQPPFVVMQKELAVP
jgi:ribosomal protein S18 acetylase RimI-like enzyme